MRIHTPPLPEMLNRAMYSFVHCLTLALTLAFFGCGGSGGGGGGGGGGTNPSLPAPPDGSYQGNGIHDEGMWFLIGEDGKMLMNFGFVRPPDVAVDLVAPLNQGLKKLETENNQYIFQFTVENKKTGLQGKVKAYYHSVTQNFECIYTFNLKPYTYYGTVICDLTLAEDDLGQSLPNYTFRDIAINVGAINVLGEGSTISFGNFSIWDNIDDLWIPCSPTLYHYLVGADNGFGFYLVDETYGQQGQTKYGTPVHGESFSLWSDLDVNGKLDLISGPRIYMNETSLTSISFAEWNEFKISQTTDPLCCAAVDYNGDSDLDLFTGYWYTNIISNPTGSDMLIKEDPASGQAVYTLYPDTLACAFAPIDFDPAAADPDVDLDLAQIVDDGGKVSVKISRCERGLKPDDPVTFLQALPDLDLPDATSLIFADVNNDLKPDLFVAGVTKASARLFRNDFDPLVGDFAFTDVTDNAFSGENPPLSGDAEFFDYNNDGLVDLLIAAPPGEKKHRLYRNETNLSTGAVKFSELTIQTNINKADQNSRTCSRCTWCDLDNDGQLDAILGLSRLWIFQNSGGFFYNLKIRPRTYDIWGAGTSYRAAVGAVVLVDMKGDGTFDPQTSIMRVIPAGRQTHLAEHFGLGDLLSNYGSTLVDVRTYFPDGTFTEMLEEDVLLLKGKVLEINHK